ncbi:MAG: hypothetical protein ABJK37_21915 [Paraglaciecola sp.]|uniref:hypothetical protein n=1 Tax=Paraglaciecola sp. TaxID=1920173 RepID=UPI003297653E
MNKHHFKNYGLLKVFTIALALLLTSNNSLAELNQIQKVYTQKGYPYGGLVDRSEQVTILYTVSSDTISCRVEVAYNGQIWKGEQRNTSLNKFTQKPLHSCLDREQAKKLLAKTF